jgi:hypothetical protein
VKSRPQSVHVKRWRPWRSWPSRVTTICWQCGQLGMPPENDQHHTMSQTPRDGLPVGLQVIGPYLEDRTVIDVAGRIADLTGGFVSPDPNDAPNSANLN